MQMAHVFEARTRDRMFQLRSTRAACHALTAPLQGFVAMPATGSTSRSQSPAHTPSRGAGGDGNRHVSPNGCPTGCPHVRAPRPPSKLPGALTPASPHGQLCSLPSTGPSPQGPFVGPHRLPPAGPPFRNLSPEAQSALQGMQQATV